MNITDAARILGIDSDAPREQIERAYRARARASHPDRFVGASEGERARAVDEFRHVREARDALIDRMTGRTDPGADAASIDFLEFVIRREQEAWTTAAQTPPPHD